MNYTKEEIKEVCKEKGTILTEKLDMDINIGRVPIIKTKDWVDTYFEKSKFELLNFNRFKTHLTSFIVSLVGTDYEIDFKCGNSECDIFIPSMNVGFKALGLYQYSEINVDKNYQVRTWNDFNASGYKIIQIFEDTWNTKEIIVKSRIRNILGKSEKLYARKCIVKEIMDTTIISKFVGEAHIQGNIGSAVKLGLYHNNELVSLMTFGKLRKNLGQVSSENSYELLRFVNRNNLNVVGGASKLFNHFINNYHPENIISYADKCWSNMDCLYSKLGMKYFHTSDASYFYIIGTKRKGRFGLRKDILLQAGFDGAIWGEHTMALALNCYRIFDCGTLKFQWLKEENKIINGSDESTKINIK